MRSDRANTSSAVENSPITYPTVPHRFICPISSLIMRRNVVLASDGKHYQKEFLQPILDSTKKSPFTRELLTSVVHKDIDLASDIEEFLAQHPQLFNSDSPESVFLPEELWNEFFHAIQVNDLKKFTAVIKLDPRLLTIVPSEAQRTGITLASKILPDINALQFARKHRALEIFNWIREHQGMPKVNSFDEACEFYPQIKLNADFIQAVKTQELSDVEALFKLGADVNAYGPPYELSALHEAVIRKHYAIVEFLLNNGAIFTSDMSGRTPLHLAAGNNELSILTLLVSRGGDIKAIDKTSNTLLHYAVRDGALNCVAFLLDNHANVNALNVSHMSPLHIICENFAGVPDAIAAEIAELLLNVGADVNMPGNSGRYPLHFAKNKRIITALLNHHANPNAIDAYSLTPLNAMQCSAYPGSYTAEDLLEKARLLLAHGAYVDGAEIPSVSGETPLSSALLHGCAELALLLLKHNAFVHVLENCRSCTMLTLAKGKCDKEAVIEALLLKGCNIIIDSGEWERKVFNEVMPIAERLNVPLRLVSWNQAVANTKAHINNRINPIPPVSQSTRVSQMWREPVSANQRRTDQVEKKDACTIS